MQIIIPMSGVGKRFVDVGYKTIKPLIQVDGKPIIEHVVNMFPGEIDFLFICNEDHLKNTDVESVLQKIVKNPVIIPIKKHKLGPVYAVLQAEKYIKDKEECIVSYCDYNMSWDYQNFKRVVKNNKCHGSIPSYIGFHPHLLHKNKYASMRVDKNNWMLEIKEKHSFTENPMDCYQSAGTYYFQSGKLMNEYFKKYYESGKNVNGEYYVSVVYDLMQNDGLNTHIYGLDKFCQWGTPEDLEEYLYWSEIYKNMI